MATRRLTKPVYPQVRSTGYCTVTVVHSTEPLHSIVSEQGTDAINLR